MIKYMAVGAFLGVLLVGATVAGAAFCAWLGYVPPLAEHGVVGRDALFLVWYSFTAAWWIRGPWRW